MHETWLLLSDKQISHIPCIAHCLQLNILADLKAAELSPLVKKCCNLVGPFKHSSAKTFELKSTHYSVCLPKDDVMFHKWQQDVATRWNSIYLKLARLLEVKNVIIQDHIDHPKNYSNPKLTIEFGQNDISADVTEYVGSEQYTTCSTVLPLKAFVHRLLMVNDDDLGYIARFKTATLIDFTNRIEGIYALPTLQMAVALDTRYNNSPV